MADDNPDLMSDRRIMTRREAEVYELVRGKGRSGCPVTALAGHRGISYPAAYRLLESLKKKGLVEDKWEAIGNKKRYYPKIAAGADSK